MKDKHAGDAVSSAVDELNRRLAGAQRWLTGALIAASVAAGLLLGGWLLVHFDGDRLAVRLVVAVFLIGAVTTMALGMVITRGILAC